MSDEHKKKLIREFQCPGCVCGVNPDDCENFKFEQVGNWHHCEGHVPGTSFLFVRSGLICLGLPKGFCRVNRRHEGSTEPYIRLHSKEEFSSHWDRCNVAVWAMEKDGFLFVRTFMPRVDLTVVDVIEGGTLDMVPGAINVGEFVAEID
jgi:hypothetical protein